VVLPNRSTLQSFRPLNAFRVSLDQVVRGQTTDAQPIDEFGVCRLITHAYSIAFTEDNICAGFRKCSIHSSDEMRLFAQARPLSFEEPHCIASVDDMTDMLRKRREECSTTVLNQVDVAALCFLDTTYGAELTSETALGLLRLQEARQMSARNKAVEDDICDERLRAKEKNRRCKARIVFERWASERRHEHYGEPLVPIRSLKERRAAAEARQKDKI